MKKNILLLALFAIAVVMPAHAEEPAVEADFEADAPTGILA